MMLQKQAELRRSSVVKKNRQTLDSVVILGEVLLSPQLSTSHLQAVLSGPISLTELHKA